MVVALAGNIVAGLATGLRKAFQTYAPSVRRREGGREGRVGREEKQESGGRGEGNRVRGGGMNGRREGGGRDDG